MSSSAGISQVDAARHLLKLKKAEKSYLGFLELLYPEMTFTSFQLELIDALDKLEKGILTQNGVPIYRLMINMPPRHGKSFICTENFPAYYMARKNKRQVMSVTYGQDLSDTFGRKIKDNLAHPALKQVFPKLELSRESRAVDFWKTSEGGEYFGLGIGGSTTGRGCNLLLIDDPFKNRTEAESQLVRNRKWQDYVSSLVSRKQKTQDGDEPIEIVIMTRWHPDDISGRIMNTYEWKVGEWMHICFKAINKVVVDANCPRHELPKDDPAYMPSPKEMRGRFKNNKHYTAINVELDDPTVTVEQEVALWPERFSLEKLQRMRMLDKREFSALYQQEPYIVGGNTMKTTWFQRYSADTLPERFHSIVIGADTAFKATTKHDYSVFVVGGICPAGDIYVLDVYRQKMEFPELKRLAVQINAKYRGKGLRGMYIEDKASGQSLIQSLKAESGIAVLPWKSVSDKVSRANAVTPLIEGGRVFLPVEAHWLDDFIQELEQFPNSTHDDQVDALVIVLDVLAKTIVTGHQLLDAPIASLIVKDPLAGELRFDQVLAPSKGGWQGGFGAELNQIKWKGFGEV